MENSQKGLHRKLAVFIATILVTILIAIVLGGATELPIDVTKATPGLEYSTNRGSGGVLWVKKVPNDTEYLVIPKEHRNLPVFGIENDIFGSNRDGTPIGSSNLKGVYIPNSIESAWFNPFASCPNLISITVDPSNPVLKGEGNCLIQIVSSELKKMLKLEENRTYYLLHAGCQTSEIPDGVIGLGKCAFMGSRLKKLTIPSSVTEISFACFFRCTDFTSIYIPNSVTSIGAGAFAECENLTIYTGFASKPEGWSEDWNPDNYPVVWGATEIPK